MTQKNKRICASSWTVTKNHCMMHGQQNVKFCNAKQATQTYKYKNIKTKFYKNNAAIWYNKTCRLKKEFVSQVGQLPRMKAFKLFLVFSSLSDFPFCLLWKEKTKLIHFTVHWTDVLFRIWRCLASNLALKAKRYWWRAFMVFPILSICVWRSGK